MNKIIVFTIADNNNLPFTKMLEESFKKFHPDIPFIVYGQKELDKWEDQQKFYRATPYFARQLIDKYDTVVKIDADSIVTGDLSYIFDSQYDVGVVYNWNRVDPKKYGEIGYGVISPLEYINCGFVVMKSKKFINHWWQQCISPFFNRMPFREQGFLNLLVYHGQYKVKFLDNYDPVVDYSAWHGLRSKGEWLKIELRKNKLILPKASDNYPERDKEIKIIHWAGGKDEKKMSYRIHFKEEVINYLDKLIK